MPLPTLLQKGYIVAPEHFPKSKKEKLNDSIGIEYLMKYLEDRVPIKGLPPKIKPTKLGDKVMILKSGTGSGKSTVIPPYLYEKFNDRIKGNIAVTQPRVLTAKDIAEGTPENYPYMKIDVNLGFSTGSMKRLPSEKGVIYMTIGTILAEINNKTPEEFMRKFSFIIIDEVHDRSIDIDMSLYKLKKLLAENYVKPECPIIILMSATFNPTAFIKYFDTPESNFIEFKGSTTYPINEIYPKYDIPNYLNYATNMAEKIHLENIKDINESEFRDILIFVQGGTQVKKIMEKLHIFNATVLSKPHNELKKYANSIELEKIGGNSNNFIAPIELTRGTFSFGGSEYQNLFSNINDITIPLYKIQDGKLTNKIDRWVKPSRRIIVATNIAETGVTIDTLKYCIDTGYVFNSSFNPDFASKMLLSKNVTKGMALQRKGRVGRKSEGFWYPCYTKETFDNLAEDQFAEILTNDITIHILNMIITETNTELKLKSNMSLKQLKENIHTFKTNYITDKDYYYLNSDERLNFSEIDMLEIPSSSALIYSLEKLYGLGFIDSQYKPTVLGLYSKGFSKVSIEIVKMILSGYATGANIFDLITISAFLSTEHRYIFDKKYKPINVLSSNMNEKEYEFYYKYIIGDQFIEYILIWEYYCEFLNNSMKSIRIKNAKGEPYTFKINNMEKWCDDHGLLYSGIVKVAQKRDELISSIISLGFNPYYNGLKLKKGTYNLLKILKNNLEDGITEIKKIKKSLLDAYRFNLIKWDSDKNIYIHHHKNMPIYFNQNPIIKSDNKPKFIIASDIMLSQSQKNQGMFEFIGNPPISIVDSLNIDLNFLNY